MMRSVRIPIAALVCCASLLPAAIAQAAETVTINSAGFSPDKLGVATNVFAGARIGSTSQATPSPITHVNLYGPAGLTLNLVGTGTCNAAELENVGPGACPANSKAGSGGGEGVFELGREVIKEKFTLELFLGDNGAGSTALLIYLNGVAPVPVQEVFTATVIQGPKPYGLGLSMNVPIVKFLPEASAASASSLLISIGTKSTPYFKTVNGKRKLFHVRGVVMPKSCPPGGWPVASQFSFEDGSTVMAKRKVPCPKR
jgi:hypothetical protein